MVWIVVEPMAGEGRIQRVAAPVWILIAAGGTAAVSLLLLFGSGDLAHLLGWAFGSIVTILLVALYRLGDRRASASPWYSPSPIADRIAMALLLVGLASAMVHAYAVAHGAAI